MSNPTPGANSIEELFDRHAAAIRAYAIRRVGPDDADDIVAEVFGTAWRKLAEVGDPALPWLLGAARNAVLHQRRSVARRLNVRDALRQARAARPSPAAEEASAVLADAVLAELPEVDAEILRLTAWEGLSPAEIAQVLGITDAAARTRLKRARQRAQRLLDGADPDPRHLAIVPTT